MTTASGPLSSERTANLQQILRNVEALVRVGDVGRAARLAGQAVASGHEHLNLLVLAAYDQLNRDDADKALVLARRATESDPHSADALNVLGLTLARLERSGEAIRAYNAALRQSPNAAHLHFNKGCALEDSNQLTHARAEFERTVGLQPSHADALAHLANLAALRGDVLSARDCAARSLKLNPNCVVAKLALASADIEERKFDKALARLSALVSAGHESAINRSIALGLTGDALDGLGRASEAFAAYASSNTALQSAYRARFEAPDIETACQRVERLISYFESAPSGIWKANIGGAPVSRSHVFLVGFPRSGTTLLQRVLDSHPDMETMSERDCLLDAASDFTLSNEGLDRLVCLPENALDTYREKYWSRAARYGHSAAGKVFLDKMPLNAVLLCVVARMFPHARILVALRDPRDVVFSCFRRRFGMTAQMYEFLSLEGAAQYYDRVMTLLTVYRDKLGLQFHDVRYEGAVAHFDEEIGKACEFLGMTWNDSMRDFAARTRSADIDTPSSAQVARGLFNYGIGQWRAYSAKMMPVLPVLAPWVAQFGYPES